MCKFYGSFFKTFIFALHIRMSEKSIIFNNKKVSKSNFYRNKKLFKIDDVDVNKILLSKKEPHGKGS